MLAELDAGMPEEALAVPEAIPRATSNSGAPGSAQSSHEASTKPVSYMKGPAYTVTRDIEVARATLCEASAMTGNGWTRQEIYRRWDHLVDPAEAEILRVRIPGLLASLSLSTRCSHAPAQTALRIDLCVRARWEVVHELVRCQPTNEKQLTSAFIVAVRPTPRTHGTW
jgi:hypothetical protein